MTKRIARNYFSIIELFLVIAVIAILATLLFPALKRSASHGEIMMCKNILRQYHVADDTYAEDNNEAYVTIRASPWRYTWFRNETFLSYLGTTETDIRNETRLTCPSYTEPSYSRFSYAPNWANNKFWWRDFRNQSLLRNRVSLTSQKIKMIENTDWHANTWQANPDRWFNNGEKNSNTVTYRHFDSCNIVFVDGHIELRHFEDVDFNGNSTLRNKLWQFKGDEFSEVY